MNIIEPDGNCFYRAISKHIFDTEELHDEIRQHTCNYMEKNKSFLQNYMSTNIDVYIADMRRQGVWADYVAIHSLSHSMGICISIFDMNGIHQVINEQSEYKCLLYYENQNHFNHIHNISLMIRNNLIKNTNSNHISYSNNDYNDNETSDSVNTGTQTNNIEFKTDHFFSEIYNNHSFVENINLLKKFERKMLSYNNKRCNICKEYWPTTKSNTDNYICKICLQNQNNRKLSFSYENDMIPEVPPRELSALNNIELLTISLAIPIMKIFYVTKFRNRLKGNCLNISNSPLDIVNILPRSVENINLRIIGKKDDIKKCYDFKISQTRISNALIWLKHNNTCYKDIEIDMKNFQHPYNQNLIDNLIEDDFDEQFKRKKQKLEDDLKNNTSYFDDDDDDIEDCSDDNGETGLYKPFVIDDFKDEKSFLEYKFSGNPINEYSTSHIASMCFPLLFPRCRGDFTRKDLKYDITAGEAVKHLMKFSYIKNNKIIYPFVEHKTFIFWAFNIIERHRLISQTKMFISNQKLYDELNVATLKEILEDTKKSKIFIDKIFNYTANVRGNLSYWYNVRTGLQNIIEQAGLPTIFFTFSSAENYWYDLQQLVCKSFPLSWIEREENIQKNQHLVDWYFVERFKEFIKIFLIKILKTEWHWFRVEFQHRGTIHIHGFARIKDSPDFEILFKKCCKGFTEQNKQVRNLDVIFQAKKSEKLIINFVDSLLICNSDNKFPIKSKLHPCSKLLTDMKINQIPNYYYDLVARTCRHLKCSEQYCLRYIKKKLQCRFGFPIKKWPYTSISYKCKKEQISTKIKIKRNDELLNLHNIFQLLGWKANVDLKIVHNEEEVTRYLTKYVTKSEPPSIGPKKFIDKMVHKKDPSSILGLLSSSILNTLGGRDIGFMECCHLLLGLPLYQTSLNHIMVNLSDSREIIISKYKETNNENKILVKNIVDFYSERNKKDEPLNLTNYIRKYHVVRNKILKRKKYDENLVIHFKPLIFPNKKSDFYYKYCILQLIKYKPWRSKMREINKVYTHEEKEDFVLEWESEINKEKSLYKYISDDLYEEEIYNGKYINQNKNCEDLLDTINLVGLKDISTDTNENEIDFIIKKLRCRAKMDNKNVDLKIETQNTDKYNKLLEFSYTEKKSFSDLDIKYKDIKFELNGEQANIIDYIVNFDLNNNPKQLLMIIHGSAGTGKSLIVQKIRFLLQNNVVVCATTGKAATNLGNNSQTIHTIFKLPVKSINNDILKGKNLKIFKECMNDIKLIIIDEFSMLDTRNMYWLDFRLKEASGKFDLIFGGYNIVLIGDIWQLPPVSGCSLFSNNIYKHLDEIGKKLYLAFTKVFVLKENMRQKNISKKDKNFVEILDKLRVGEVADKDWEFLKKRFSYTEKEVSKDILRIYATNEKSKIYNLNCILNSQEPIIKIKAKDSNRNMKYIDEKKLGNLPYVIYVTLGMPIFLTKNIDISRGLANGTLGIIRDFIWIKAEKNKNEVNVLVIEFPALIIKPNDHDQRNKFYPIYRCSINNEKNFKQNRCQFPISYGYSMTIHKSQGSTYESAFIDIGDKEFCIGLSFVALSRVKDINKIYLSPFSFERIKINKKENTFIDKMKESKRLDFLGE